MDGIQELGLVAISLRQTEAQTNMLKGQIKKWFDDRGFGFIQPDDGGDDIFARVSVIEGGRGTPQIGTQVTYETIKDPRTGKVRAANVRY